MSTESMNGDFHERDVHAFSAAFGLTAPQNGKLQHAVHWAGLGRDITHASLEPQDSMVELSLTVAHDEALAPLYARSPNGWSMYDVRRELYTLFSPGDLGNTLERLREMWDIPDVASEEIDLTFASTDR